MKLSDIFKFGKYKGHTLNDVVNYDPQYVIYCVNYIHNFKLDETAKPVVAEKYNKFLKNQRMLKVGYNVSLFED